MNQITEYGVQIRQYLFRMPGRNVRRLTGQPPYEIITHSLRLGADWVVQRRLSSDRGEQLGGTIILSRLLQHEQAVKQSASRPFSRHKRFAERVALILTHTASCRLYLANKRP